ncbi:MAG: hypothetical protein MHMPM18_000137 [Marteilia pararefringens]
MMESLAELLLTQAERYETAVSFVALSLFVILIVSFAVEIYEHRDFLLSFCSTFRDIPQSDQIKLLLAVSAIVVCSFLVKGQTLRAIWINVFIILSLSTNLQKILVFLRQTSNYSTDHSVADSDPSALVTLSQTAPPPSLPINDSASRSQK